MSIKKLLFNNLHLKLLALLVALLIWAVVVGQARAFSTKNLEVGVTYHGVLQHIDVRDVQPAKVLVSVRGVSRLVENLDASSLTLSIDLRDVKRAGESAFFSEDYLKVPDGIEVRQIQPRIVRVISDEFSTREVPVRILYKGKFPNDVGLIERKVFPERVTLFGYLSQIIKIDRVEGEFAIDLDTIDRNKKIRVPLMKLDGVIRFEGASEVEVEFIVNSPNNPETNRDRE